MKRLQYRGELGLGLGLDVLILGGYGGICVEEVADFVAGIFFIELRDDNWQ